MKDAIFEKFVKRWEEVTEIPPQTLGPLTGVYKSATRRLKVMPWPWYAAAGTIVAAACYVYFGNSVARFVSVLQQGF
jgi:hypothetical protein